MLIYCMKCKRRTDTKNEKTIDNYRVVGICSVCGKKKSQFIKRN